MSSIGCTVPPMCLCVWAYADVCACSHRVFVHSFYPGQRAIRPGLGSSGRPSWARRTCSDPSSWGRSESLPSRGRRRGEATIACAQRTNRRTLWNTSVCALVHQSITATAVFVRGRPGGAFSCLRLGSRGSVILSAYLSVSGGKATAIGSCCRGIQPPC